MSSYLKVLILEDNPEDAEIIQDIITHAGMLCTFHVTPNRETFADAIISFLPDVILSDNSLPQFDSEEALHLTRQLLPYVPFILVTGTVSEEYAVRITKRGADDYILKDRLARLPAAISAALQFRKAEIQVNETISKLFESEDRYRKLVGRITDAFISLDTAWKFTFVNKKACEFFGKEETELVGKPIWDLLTGPPGQKIFHAYQHAMNQQEYGRYEAYYEPFQQWLEHYIYPSPGGLSVFIRDVTVAAQAAEKLALAREEKEMMGHRMSAILNTLPANIALLDSTGIIIDVNDAWKKFSRENGHTTPDHGIGVNYIDVSLKSFGADREDGIKVARGIQAVFKNKEKEFVFEYPCHSASVKRWFRMIVTPLSEKIYSGAVVMHIDITALKKMEQERINNKAAEQKKLTRAIVHAQEKERNVLGRELHDNVNQILAGTKLILSTAQMYPGNHEKIISSAIENLQKAIDENRKIAHELVAPDFREIKVIEELTNLTDGMLKNAGIAITIDAKGMNEMLLDDDQKLTVYRVAQEQCTNILKYAGAKSVRIVLSMTSNVFTMKIADDGNGMEQGKEVKGIGLRNMKSRLELFNGTVRVETGLHKGFTLEIKMPLVIKSAGREPVNKI